MRRLDRLFLAIAPSPTPPCSACSWRSCGCRAPRRPAERQRPPAARWCAACRASLSIARARGWHGPRRRRGDGGARRRRSARPVHPRPAPGGIGSSAPLPASGKERSRDGGDRPDSDRGEIGSRLTPTDPEASSGLAPDPVHEPGVNPRLTERAAVAVRVLELAMARGAVVVAADPANRRGGEHDLAPHRPGCRTGRVRRGPRRGPRRRRGARRRLRDAQVSVFSGISSRTSSAASMSPLS